MTKDNLKNWMNAIREAPSREDMVERLESFSKWLKDDIELFPDNKPIEGDKTSEFFWNAHGGGEGVPAPKKDEPLIQWTEMCQKAPIQELAAGLQSNMFASRDTPKEGYEYCIGMLERCIEKEDTIYMLTAVHVLMNSIADHLSRLCQPTATKSEVDDVSP